MENENRLKHLLSYIFVAILFLGFIGNNSFGELSILSEYLQTESTSVWENSQDDAKEKTNSLTNLESQYTDKMPEKKELIELNGRIAKNLQMRGLYSDIGIYITDENYIISCYSQASTDYEYEQLVDFYQFLKDNNIKFLYVNQPVKYLNDDILEKNFGMQSFSNQNADKLVSRLRQADIPVLDLRDNITSENLNSLEMFYRTDHHWTTKAGLWAAQRIAQAMNENCGYQIDTDLFDISNFNVKHWKNCWLGEQGRKVARSYVGLDDFYEIRPNFSFDGFIDDSRYNLTTDVYKNGSWHFSYQKPNCVNNNVTNGKVLMLADSYGNATEPFLSLGIHEIHTIDRRTDIKKSLRERILNNQYDTVIICYSQIMIGAHANPNSSNYPMFVLDQ